MEMAAALAEAALKSGQSPGNGLTHMIFSVGDSYINELCIFRFFAGRENEGGVCCGILGLVFPNSSKITAVTDNSRANSFQLIKRRSHVAGCRVLV